jgi:hypothetical protein
MEIEMNFKRAFLTLVALMLLPGLAVAQDEIGTVRFNVEKLWVDTDLELNLIDQEVVVEIVCNTGLPLTQEATISSGPGNGVVFVVKELVETAGVECTINEKQGVNPGFVEWGVSNGQIPQDLMLGGCIFTGDSDVLGNMIEFNECILVNQARPATLTVTTDWFVDGGGEVIELAEIFFKCNEQFFPGGLLALDGYWYEDFGLVGDGEVTITVNTRTDGTAACTVSDKVESSAVESSSTCGTFLLEPGEDVVCGYEYTVFFEGIPTLSQYGLAIMALLMLGVGFVGFRRFV